MARTKRDVVPSSYTRKMEQMKKMYMKIKKLKESRDCLQRTFCRVRDSRGRGVLNNLSSELYEMYEKVALDGIKRISKEIIELDKYFLC